jgi:hypothetical protein
MSHHSYETVLGEGLPEEWQTVGGIGAARADDDLEFGSLAPCFLRKFVAVQAGHLDIGNEDFDACIGSECCQRVRAATGGHHLAAKVFQHRCRKREDEGFIIDNENQAGHVNLPGKAGPRAGSAREVNKPGGCPFPIAENATRYR